MTARPERDPFSLDQEPLGPLAVNRKAREDLRALLAAFEASCTSPPPDYSEFTLRRFFPGRRP